MEKIKIVQYSIFGFTQLCGLIAFFILVSLLSSCGGIHWSNSLNIHAFLMMFGMVYLQGLAISAFRVLTFVERVAVKIAHASVTLCAFVLAAVGLGEILSSSESYSLHGVIGLITFCLFVIQWLFGCGSFLFPKLPADKRAIAVFVHRVSGAVVFALAALTAIVGLSSYISIASLTCLASKTFSLNSHQTNVSGLGISAGLFTLLYGLLTVFILRSKLFKPDH